MKNIDCQTPEEASIAYNALGRPKFIEHAPHSGIRTARFIIDNETFLMFDELKKNSKVSKVQIDGDAKSQFHWVGKKNGGKPLPPNSL